MPPLRVADLRRIRQVLTDLVEAPLQAQLIEGAQTKIAEDTDVVEQHAEGVVEGRMLLDLRPLDGGRIRRTAMGGHRLARPDRPMIFAFSPPSAGDIG